MTIDRIAQRREKPRTEGGRRREESDLHPSLLPPNRLVSCSPSAALSPPSAFLPPPSAFPSPPASLLPPPRLLAIPDSRENGFHGIEDVREQVVLRSKLD